MYIEREREREIDREICIYIYVYIHVYIHTYMFIYNVVDCLIGCFVVFCLYHVHAPSGRGRHMLLARLGVGEGERADTSAGSRAQ